MPNVAIIHCKGKSRERSALLCAATLLADPASGSVQAVVDKVCQALAATLASPGQLRYLKYMEGVLRRKAAFHATRLHLHKMRFTSIPHFKSSGGCGKFPHVA